MAWCNAVMHSVNEFVPFRLHKIFLPDQVYRSEEKPTSSGIWDKYLKGDVLPSEGTDARGMPRIVTAVGIDYPGTLKAFRHVLWTASYRKTVTTADFQRELAQHSFQVARYYKSFSVLLPADPDGELLEAIGEKLWIEHGDWESAMDHLALHLMLIQWGERSIASSTAIELTTKLGMLMGMASESPWIHSFYEQLYDYLEATLWGDLFDDFYPTTQENADLKGWRRCTPCWD